MIICLVSVAWQRHRVVDLGLWKGTGTHRKYHTATTSPRNTRIWYIVENGQFSMCLMGFPPDQAAGFETDATESSTRFYPFGQGQDAEQKARGELEHWSDEYEVYYPKASSAEPEANSESSTDCHSFESAWEVDEETRRALQYEHEANLAEIVVEMSLLENL